MLIHIYLYVYTYINIINRHPSMCMCVHIIKEVYRLPALGWIVTLQSSYIL